MPQARRISSLACLLGAALLLAQSALAAPPEGKGKPHKEDKGNKHEQYESSAGSVTLTTERARSIAVDYGCTGYASLPPGQKKNLARGKPLPPGIAKKVVPSACLNQLPVYSGYEWRMAGSDLIRVQIGSSIVVDVFGDIFR